MFFKNLPLSFSVAESTVLRLQVDCKTFFVVIVNGICLLALNIRVKTLRENYSLQLWTPTKKTLKNKLKLNKWNNYQAYLCGNFWNNRKVEMSKLDCTSIRITGNTNFKKKLTSFVSKSVWGNPARKVNWNSPTHSRRWSCCFSTVPWTTVMNEHWGTKNNTHRSYFLKNLFENPNVSVLKWNSLILALCARLRLLKLN